MQAQRTTPTFARFVWLGVIVGALTLSAAGRSKPSLRQTAHRSIESSSAELVGRLGDVARLSIDGNGTYTDEMIKDALLEDPEFLVATHPRAPLTGFLQVLRRKVLLGYRRGGFPNVAASLAVDAAAGRINVDIIEGLRFNNGDVVVNGATLVPVDALVNRLTRPRWIGRNPTAAVNYLQPALPDDAPSFVMFPQQVDEFGRPVQRQEPIWIVGEPAQFDETSRAGLAGKIQPVLRELGFFSAKIDVSVVPDTQHGTATLVVNLLDEGPQAIVSDIVITGCEKNTPEEIIAYLGLSTGMPVSDGTVRRIEHLLWASARFMEHNVTVSPSDTTNDVILNIKLTECEMASPLSAELSPEQRILLRSIDWLSNKVLGETDLVMSGDVFPLGGEMILSRRGTVLSLAPPKNPQLSFEVAVNSETIALYLPALTRAIVVESPKMRLRASISLLPNPSQQILYLTYGMQVNSKIPEGEPQLGVDMLLAPVAIWWLDPEGYGYSMDEERSLLAITGEDFRLVVKAPSGEFIEAHYQGLEDTRRLDIVTADGAFDEARKRISSIKSAYTNSGSISPIGRLAPFALGALVRSNALGRYGFPETSPETRDRAANAIEKITERVVALSSAYLDQLEAETDDQFVIPLDQSSSKDAAMRALWAKLAAGAFKMINEFLPDNSWPGRVSREAVYMFSGQWKYAGDTLKAVYESPETGPIGHLFIAKWIARSSPALGRRFASRGLERLSHADFRKDYALFLEGTTGLTRVFKTLASELAVVEENDFDAVVAIIPSATADILRTCVGALRQGRRKPIAEVLGPVLDRAWTQTVRAQIERDLRVLAGDTPGSSEPSGDHTASIRIGDETVTASQIWKDLRTEVDAGADRLNLSGLAPFAQRRAKQLIQQRVTESLLYQEAVWTPTSLVGQGANAYADAQIQELVSEKQNGSQESFERYLADQGQTLDQMRGRLERAFTVSNYLDKVVKPAVAEPSDQEVRAMLDLQQESLHKPERRRMSLIEVRVVVPDRKNGSHPSEEQIANARAAALAKAEQAKRELEAGACFSDVARRHSSGIHAAEGGAWGWISRGSVRERFEKVVEVLYTTDVEDVSDIVETPQSYFIVRCDERDPGTEPELESIRLQIREQLLRQRHDKRIEELVAQLRETASIDPAELDVLHRTVVELALANSGG